MKVGILTYHWVCNFGAQLQTLSTFKFLERNGCNPIIINWVPNDALSYYEQNVDLHQKEKHASFIKSHCAMTEEFHSPSDITEVIKRNGISHIIIGSDSLFNIQIEKSNFLGKRIHKPTLDHTFPNPFWGYGFEKVPHVGLSISSQNANFKNFSSRRAEIGQLLQYFNEITVRDEWTKNLVHYFSHGKIQPQVTPDPVFAFNANVKTSEKRESFLSRFHLPDKYVLFSFATGRMHPRTKWIDTIMTLFHNKGYKCVLLPKIVGGCSLDLDLSIPTPLDPLDWYNLIRYSSGYIGVLMHPIVVCLHNAVPFYSFDHYGLGIPMLADKSSSKIYDILNRADLLQYHFFQRNHLSYPSAVKVFRLIMNFPKEKSEQFANYQQDCCLMNMKQLLKQLYGNENEGTLC